VHHDLWDYDGPSPVVLFDIEIDGRLRKGLAQPSKTGWVYILDRTNGEPLIGIEERAVPQEPRQATAATQPYPVGDAFVPQHIDIAPEGYKLINEGRIFTPFWSKQDVIAKPAISGGANWPPSSYDPRTGYLYVCATDRVGVFRAEEISTARPPEGERYAAGIFGGTTMPAMGVFAAMDMRTNKIVWRQQWTDACYSGSTATAGGLVFVGRNDGRLLALDAATGAHLWQFQTGAGMNAPVSVFEHEGTQYVAAYSAGNLFAGSAKGDSVWLFSLEGTLDAVAPASSVMSFSGLTESAADVGRGASVYRAACLFCHGEEGTGGEGGGGPLGGSTTLGAFAQVVSEGRGDMPAFGATLTPEQIRDVGTYALQSLIFIVD
jgi:alcohol dehydrogenase (cytochrome c)